MMTLDESEKLLEDQAFEEIEKVLKKYGFVDFMVADFRNKTSSHVESFCKNGPYLQLNIRMPKHLRERDLI